jgi:aerobic carbon-monoxide dehydrogenase large subunit
MNDQTRERAVGRSLRRVEDRRFVIGSGRYTADCFQTGDLVAGFLRSDVANGRILSVSTEVARSLEGVVAILTADDIRRAGARAMRCVYNVQTVDGAPMFDPGRPALAEGFVRFVGDPIALVVAENSAAVRDAIELIEVDIEELPSVTDLRLAVAEDAPIIWEGAGGNVSFSWQAGDRDATKVQFEHAAHVVSLELDNNRIAISPLETRGMRVSFDPTTSRTNLECATQGAHELRNYLADEVFNEPRERFRVVTPDVGGSFGMKIMCYAEHVAMVVAARVTGRPVTWMATRTESFLSDNHGRDHVTRIEMALDDEGRFLALRCDTLANLGGYIAQTGAMIPTLVYSTVFGGCYDFSAVHMQVRGVFTNQPSTDAYRGAGVPESTYALERLVDVAARETGFDRFELRRRNLVVPDRMPYAMAIGETIDVGDFLGTFDAALSEADVAGFPARKAEAAEQGRALGLGLCCYIHGTGGYPDHDMARVEMRGDGSVTVFCGAVQAGQGHETAFAQIVADRLGVDPSQVSVREGDSDDLESSGGTGGSSSMVVAARSVHGAVDVLLEDAAPAAAGLLQVGEGDVEFRDGRFVAKAGGASVALVDVAAEIESRARAATKKSATETAAAGCTGTARFEGNFRSFPYGTHVCEISVNTETCEARVERYIAVDDIGRVINPMIAEGQLHGGVAQGLGQALLENVVYDLESGQLLTASLMDYAMPRAETAPAEIRWISRPTVAQFNPLGMKGIGEIGTIAAPPAAINALCDALDIRHVDMPAVPGRIFDLVWA